MIVDCANPDCDKIFVAVKKNRKFCSPACSSMAQKRSYSAETLSRLVELYKSGVTYTNIGKELGLSKDMVAKLCKKEGLTKPKGRPKAWKPEEVSRLSELLGSGMGFRDVAEAMGKSYGAVWSKSLRVDQAVIDPPICCPVCDQQTDIRSRRRFGPWHRSQEKLMLKLASLRVPHHVIGAVFNTDTGGVQRKLKQIRSRAG